MQSTYNDGLWEHIPEGLEPQLYRVRLEFLLGVVQRGERVLDVGCGEAAFTAALAEAGALPVGIDVAGEPLARARGRHQELDLRLVQATGQWPLEDSSFDVVWAGEVLEHVLDTGQLLSEIRRVLRSGGTLLLSTPDHGRLSMLLMALGVRSFEGHFDPRSDHIRFYTGRSLRELLLDFRFEQIHIERVGGIPGARQLLLARGCRSRF